MKSVWIIPALAVLCTVGCGDTAKTVKTVSVSGTVYLDDKPLESAVVNFVGENHAGTGRTDAEGKFYLAAGAEPGKNIIFFSKISDPKLDPASGMDEGQLQAAAAGQGLAVVPGQMIPQEYATAQSMLTFNVPTEGAKNADFKLVSKK